MEGKPASSQFTSSSITPPNGPSTQNVHFQPATTPTPENVSGEKHAPRFALGQDPNAFLRGVRYWLVVVLCLVMLFAVQIEAIIVTTSLVAITKEIGGFDISAWAISSYLLGFVGLVVIMAKLSDVLGRKPMMLVCISLFTIFSGGCAAANTMPQLIILRAFQGMGGGGSFALSLILLIQIVPTVQYPKMAGYAGIATVMSTTLGPIFGGAISQNTTWRWIFLFNIPVGALGFLLAITGLPNGYPHHGRDVPSVPISQKLKRIDFLGCLLLLLATMSFTSAFQEVNSRFSWGSAYFIVLIIASAVLWCALVLWERRVTLANGVREAVLPWRFFISRPMMGVLFGIVILGGPLVVVNFQLPQRFQLMNGRSTLNASIQLLPFSAAIPLGIITSSILLSRLKVPFMYVVFIGSAFQVVGFALLGTLKGTASIPPVLYGYEILCGFGTGLSYLGFMGAVPYVTDEYDHAVGVAATNQFRSMGGALVLAVATSLFNDDVYSKLRDVGISDPAKLALAATQNPGVELTPHLANELREILSDGYNRQMFLLCACGAAQSVAAMLMLQKKKQLHIP